MKIPTDLYQRFSLPDFASLDDVKKAYRRLALRYHPDREGGSEEAMKAVNEIYEALSKHKDTYDAYLRRVKYPAKAKNVVFTFNTGWGTATMTTTEGDWNVTIL